MASTLLFRDKSLYNGADIFATLTPKSSNTKTGDIPQVTILVEDEKPTDALKSGADEAICGNCPLRPSLHKKTKIEKLPCYVNCGFGPNSIFRTKDKIKDHNGTRFPIGRLGAHGDTASVPKSRLKKIVDLFDLVMNYTHDWKRKRSQWLEAFTMASVHSIKEKAQALELGFRTFRTVKLACLKLDADEIVCPNFTRSIQCKECGLCGGNQTPTAKNIVIPIH
jgi:hypothetical protein